MKLIKHILLFAACSMGTHIVFADASEAVDPLSWSDHYERPGFGLQLAQEEYERRLDAVWSKLDLATLESSKAPPRGVRITAVQNDTYTQQLGLKPGEFITHFGGDQKIWSMYSDWPVGPQDIRVVDVSGVVRTVRVPGPKPQIELATQWQPELIYLRSDQRNPKWDKPVLVGLLACETDPELAETAWHHAVNSGYKPDTISDACGSVIAFKQGRHADAVAFLWRLLQAAKSGEEYPIRKILIYRIALGNFKLIEGAPFTGNLISRKHLGDIVEMHRSLPPEKRAVQPPHVRMKSMARIDLCGLATNYLKDTWKQSAMDAIAKGRPFHLGAPDAHYERVGFEAPYPVSNARLSLQFRAWPSSNKRTKYAKIFIVSIADKSYERHRAEGWASDRIVEASFEMAHDGPNVYLRHSSRNIISNYVDPALHLDKASWHSLEMIKIDGQAEIFIDGSRVAYVPADTRVSDMWFHLRANGMQVDIKDLKVEKLVDADLAKWPLDRDPSEIAETGDAIDLLPIINPELHTRAGQWDIVDGVLRTVGRDRNANIRIPLLPRGPYTLKATFTRRKGKNAIDFVLPVGDRIVCARLGGWDNRFSGLESLNGKSPSGNSTSRRALIESDKTYSIALHVIPPATPDGDAVIEAILDGQPYLFWRGPVSSLTYEMPKPLSLGLATWWTTAVDFEKMTLELGKPKLMTPELQRGLIGHWNFDEQIDGTKVRDQSSHGNDGILLRNAAIVLGQSGHGLRPDGIKDGMAVENGPALHNIDQLSLCCWVRFDQLQPGRRLIEKAVVNQPRGNASFRLLLTEDADAPKIRFRVWGETSPMIQSDGPPPVDKWVHVAAVYDGRELCLYVDGVKQKETAAMAGPLTTFTHEMNKLSIGTGDYATAQSAAIKGIIDDVRIFKRGLSADEVRAVIKESSRQ